MSQDKCPVDHESRKAWMQHAEQARAAQADGVCPVDHSKMAAVCPVDHSMAATVSSMDQIPHPEACSSDRLDAFDNDMPSLGSSEPALSDARETSSIPRSGTGKNWVYPSQRQFFNAMKRKNFDPQAADMQAIIPIHNAVNERAWMEIIKWEDGFGADQCGGPELVRFEGDARKISPRARWNMFLGRQRPFDRHDWTVNRCGKEIDYVIDFYTGKANPLMPDMPSFYLDTRPKLNSFEGVKMRLLKFLGF